MPDSSNRVCVFPFPAKPPPEFGHGQRTVAVTVGILQQFGGGTLSGTRWRYGPPVFPENLPQVFLLPPCVQHAELGEKPILQQDGAVFPFGFQRLYLFIGPFQGSFNLFEFGFPLLFQPFVFSFQELAFTGELFFREVVAV